MQNEGNPPVVLVIGATSSVGSLLVRELTEDPGPQNVRVRAAVRRPAQAEALAKEGIESVHLDLNRVETIPRALEGIDRVFLLTGYTVDMLPQSKAVVDAAVKAGVRQIVHVGTMAPEDTDLPHFGWHRYVERYIEGSGIGFTHLAPNMFMQNLLGRNSLWQSLGTPSAAASGAIHFFLGEARIGWIDAHDIARTAAAVLRSPAAHAGRKYNLSAEAMSVPEIAAVLTDVVGRPFHSVPHSPEEFLDAVLKGGMEPVYARCAAETLRRFADNAVPGQADVTDDVRLVTGARPTLWRDFASEHQAAFK